MKSNIFNKILLTLFGISSLVTLISSAVFSRPVVALISFLISSISIIVLTVFMQDEAVRDGLKILLAFANILFATLLMASLIYIGADPTQNLIEEENINGLPLVLAIITVITYYYKSLVSKDLRDTYRDRQ